MVSIFWTGRHYSLGDHRQRRDHIPARGGAIFGYRLLWIFLLVGLLKWILAYSSMRHMILSGGHPLERWTSIPGPKGWVHLFIFITAAVAFPMIYAFLAGVLGTACAWMFRVGDHYL